MSDAEDWAREAERMVAEIPDVPARIARAMRAVPRHWFVPSEYRREAYEDEPLPLPHGDATISAPHMVALQLEYLALEPDLKVLEVGSGSGYLAALIAELTAPEGRVFGIDIDSRLVRDARRRLDTTTWGGRIALKLGDGREGWREEAPFDRIVVSCATPELYETWRGQLRHPGILVAPVGSSSSQDLVRYVTGPGGGTIERGPACRFVPLRGRLPSDI
ncbi:MAG TPA: methyltransferase domain-containing protein [Thermoplasmata archaeon]|nr:methyltransferase domain-containing protein [Thermoplasmata archaeon]